MRRWPWCVEFDTQDVQWTFWTLKTRCIEMVHIWYKSYHSCDSISDLWAWTGPVTSLTRSLPRSPDMCQYGTCQFDIPDTRILTDIQRVMSLLNVIHTPVIVTSMSRNFSEISHLALCAVYIYTSIWCFSMTKRVCHRSHKMRTVWRHHCSCPAWYPVTFGTL